VSSGELGSVERWLDGRVLGKKPGGALVNIFPGEAEAGAGSSGRIRGV